MTPVRGEAERPAELTTAVIAHHVSPEQAGDIFTRTKPKLAVYSHIVLPIATDQDLIPPTRKTYGRPLEFGEDLMVIEVGEELQRGVPRCSPFDFARYAQGERF